MSRLRKKLQGKDMLAAMRDSDDDEIAAMSMLKATAQSRKNKKKQQRKVMTAAALQPSDDDDDEGVGGGDAGSDDAPAAVEEPRVPPPRSDKKKNKNKKKAASPAPVHADPEPPVEEEDDEEDIDAILQAHAAKQKEKAAGKKKGKGRKAEAEAAAAPADDAVTTAPEDIYGADERRVAELLACDRGHLDADAELKRIFGAEVLAAARAEENTNQGRNRVRMQHMHPAARMKAKAVRFRPSLLAKPDPKSWPKYDNAGYTFDPALAPIASGHRLGSAADAPAAAAAKKKPMQPVFNITEGADAVKANQMLDTAVNAMSIEAFSQLLYRNPYHIPILLRCSELASQLGQHSEAADMVDQALYAADMASVASDFAWDAPFTTRHLPFETKANRAVFWAVEKKIQSMIKKGCHRTALEWCKLLLNLDPSDPSHAMMLMGFCAAKCGEWAWFLALADALGAAKATNPNLYGVAQLPQFKFSVALCAKLIETQQEHAGGAAASSSSSSASPPARSPDSLLKEAIRWYPTAAPAVLAAVKCTDPAVAGLAPDAAVPHTAGALVSLFTARYAELFSGVLSKWLLANAAAVAKAAAEGGVAPVAELKDLATSAIFRHHAQCEQDMHMGRTTVIPEEAMEDAPEGLGGGDGEGWGEEGEEGWGGVDEDGNPAGLPEALRNFLANMPEEGGEGGEGVDDEDGGMSEALQMLAVAEMEIESLKTAVADAVATAPAASSVATYVELNELVTRQLLFLDNVMAEGGDAEAVRTQRRALVQACHGLVADLENHYAKA